ncbi:MAG: BglII/BstYI family type II restriction endonuclease [Phycisphaerales bacterium]
MAKKRSKSSGGEPAESGSGRTNFVERSRTGNYDSDPDLRGRIPDSIFESYECRQWKHAGAILATDFPEELADIVHVLSTVKLHKRFITDPGGGKGKYAKAVDHAFRERGWTPKRWSTAIVVDDVPAASPTHEVDCFKNRIGLELEWSNKDPFYDRDLNNFRLLFDLRVISVGVIITKSDELAGLLWDLDVWSKYGTTTTWMSKLLPRVRGGGGGGCPLIVFGIRKTVYTEA